MMFQKPGSAHRCTTLLMVVSLLQFGAAAELLLDTRGVASYNRWVLKNRDTLPALRLVWATVEGPSTSTQDSPPICRVRFWREDGSLRKSVELRCCDGAFVVDPYPYVIASYCGDESCLVYDSTGHTYLRQTPDSTVIWGASGRLCFRGWYQVCPGDPMILVLTSGGIPVDDNTVVLSRDGTVVNRVPGQRELYVSAADVYRSPSGTSVLAMREFVALDRRGDVLWRKPRGCHEDIYLSADGSTFARAIQDSAGLAFVAYDHGGTPIARFAVADYVEYARLSADGRFAALYGRGAVTLASITGQKALWQVTLPWVGGIGNTPEMLDARSDAVVVAFDSIYVYRNHGPYTVHMLTDGHEMGPPLRLQNERVLRWRCSVAGNLLVAQRGERFRVYALWSN